MHHEETMNLGIAPIWTLSGAPRRKDGLSGDVDSNSGTMTITGGGGSGATANGTALPAEWAPDGIGGEHRQLHSGELNGGDEEDIADNVDGFLDDFMALAGADSDFVDGAAGTDFMVDEDLGGGGDDGGDLERILAGIEDADLAAFWPPLAGSDDGAGADVAPLPFVQEVVPPKAAAVAAGVDEDHAAATPVIVASSPASAPAHAAFAAAGVMSPVEVDGTAESPPACGDISSAGRALATDAAASSAPAAELGGGAAISGEVVGTAAGSGVEVAAGVSHKEQLRRQRVARNLAKKQTRCKSKPPPSKSRQRVANSRPRDRGRFAPFKTEFISTTEHQRRQRAQMKQMKEKVAALAVTTMTVATPTAEAQPQAQVSYPQVWGASPAPPRSATAFGDGSPSSPEGDYPASN